MGDLEAREGPEELAFARRGAWDFPLSRAEKVQRLLELYQQDLDRAECEIEDLRQSRAAQRCLELPDSPRKSAAVAAPSPTRPGPPAAPADRDVPLPAIVEPATVPILGPPLPVVAVCLWGDPGRSGTPEGDERRELPRLELPTQLTTGLPRLPSLGSLSTLSPVAVTPLRFAGTPGGAAQPSGLTPQGSAHWGSPDSPTRARTSPRASSPPAATQRSAAQRNAAATTVRWGGSDCVNWLSCTTQGRPAAGDSWTCRGPPAGDSRVGGFCGEIRLHRGEYVRMVRGRTEVLDGRLADWLILVTSKLRTFELGLPRRCAPPSFSFVAAAGQEITGLLPGPDGSVAGVEQRPVRGVTTAAFSNYRKPGPNGTTTFGPPARRPASGETVWLPRRQSPPRSTSRPSGPQPQRALSPRGSSASRGPQLAIAASLAAHSAPLGGSAASCRSSSRPAFR